MSEQRLIDGNELREIESLLNTDIIQGSEEASWLMSQVLHDIDAMPTIDPETLPIVRELRAELGQAKQELRQVKYCYEIAKNGEKQLRRQVDEITGAWAECAKKLEHVTTERDAAISQLHGYCPVCKNYTEYHGQGPCATCCHEHFLAALHTKNDNWEWKGI